MGCKEKLEDALCVYKSTRFIRVRNKKLVIVYYSALVLVLIYICVYTIYIDRGYQATDPVTGTTSVKLKGTGSVGGTTGYYFGNETVYDAMDLVVPSIEENAFFVTTSMILTPDQERDTCPGNKDVQHCNSTDNSCPSKKGLYDPMSQGIYTGNCCSDTISPFQCTSTLNSTYPYDAADRCEVMAWCPTEIDSKSVAQHVENIGAFTVFVKVDVAFSAFGKTRSNTMDKDGTGLPVDGYNLFSLNEIIGNATGGKIKTVNEDIQTNGAIILMESQWNCNFTGNNDDDCNPVWKVSRIDSEPDTISYGFNYRAVNYDTNMNTRLLRKLYGIRVVYTVSGMGREFSFATLTVTFGAGLAYLGVAAFLADIVLEKFLPESDMYMAMKNKEEKKSGGVSLHIVDDKDNGNVNADYREFSESTHENGIGTVNQ